MKKQLVINLFGAPGAGKSTGAAYVFSRLKRAGVRAELVTEVAKDEVWEGNVTALENQEYVFGKQSLRQSRLKDRVDVIVTDSPLLLTMVYGKSKHQAYLNALALAVFGEYDNRNYFVNRVKPYERAGRLQTETESDSLSETIKSTLKENGIEFQEIDGYIDDYDEIFDSTLDEVRKRKEEQIAREERQSET